MASLKSVLETVGKDIVTGLEKAAPFLTDAGVIPVVGPILSSVGTIVTSLENSSGKITMTPAMISELIQAVALVEGAKQVGTGTTIPTSAAPATS